MSYRISAPDEYLAITGMGVRTVRITKASWVLPFQRCARFSVQPHDYAMDLQAMTLEKLLFKLPCVFTIGPDVNARGANANAAAASADHGSGGANSDGAAREDRGDALVKYAMLLAESGNKKSEQKAHLDQIIKGIIEGETRVLVSSMTMEEIFAERDVFKRRIFRNIQSELNQFGLRIYNANIKELKDAPNSNYFDSLSRKAHEGATNQARIDVAEAQLRGNVGEAKRRGEQEREIAKIHAETAVQKTERDVERAQAEAHMQTRQTAFNRDVQIAQAEAQRALEARDEDLRKDVEVRKAAAETERLRAKEVVRATIEKESKQQAADAAAYEIEANARAEFEAARMAADAEAYTSLKSAEADAIRRIKEAEGLSAMADAYGKMSHAFGGPEGLLKFIMLEKGTYGELARANAEAVKGMAPKISLWNTTGSGGAGNGQQDPADAMRSVYQMLPPLMTTIHDQTGVTLPEWQFGHLAKGTEAVNNEGKANGR
ncbi:hypothetical protein N3K66_004023 [Trichothecium roseum]|uniref:Uncharacterized protein n=1 Tax=Trichothecium roseum TaxID=47278 RepID=A0ACC0V735_9HYPO|nr:hypothetical protein N3K66_004023 [Trichothecium roseum]